MDVRYNNNALAQLNDYIGGLLHSGTNVITFSTLLHLGQLLHLGLHYFIKTMRVVHRTDPVIRATQLKQLLVNPVEEFLALVGHHNFRHSISGDLGCTGNPPHLEDR